VSIGERLENIGLPGFLDILIGGVYSGRGRMVEGGRGSREMGSRAVFLTVLRAFFSAFFAACSVSFFTASYITLGLRTRCGR
jgi:hypothetical protein